MSVRFSNLKVPAKGTEAEVASERSENHILLDKRTDSLCLQFQILGFY